MTELTAVPFGDAAVMVTGEPGPAGRARVRELGRLLEAHPVHGVVDLVAGLDSLLVRLDPLSASPEGVCELVHRSGSVAGPGTDGVADAPARTFAIPVVFDAGSGPDLEAVAAELDQSVEALVASITGSTFDVVLLAAGMAPMMEGGRFAGSVRRAAQPRTNVPPGSIMIAGQNAIIQPFPGPTGWRVVGRTPHVVVDIRRDDPAAIRPGDRVRYVATTRADAERLDGVFLAPDEPEPTGAER